MKNHSLKVSDLQQILKQTKASFIYDESEDNHENEVVAVYFLSKNQDKVIHCTFITLIFEYQITLLAEAENIFFATYPEWQEKDYQEMPEKLQDEYDETVEDLHASGDIQVEEFVEEEEENILEVGLNVESFDAKTIEDFIIKYHHQKLQLDSNLYQFEIFDEE